MQTLTLRALPQSASLTAPSRKEPWQCPSFCITIFSLFLLFAFFGGRTQFAPTVLIVCLSRNLRGSNSGSPLRCWLFDCGGNWGVRMMDAYKLIYITRFKVFGGAGAFFKSPVYISACFPVSFFTLSGAHARYLRLRRHFCRCFGKH